MRSRAAFTIHSCLYAPPRSSKNMHLPSGTEVGDGASHQSKSHRGISLGSDRVRSPSPHPSDSRGRCLSYRPTRPIVSGCSCRSLATIPSDDTTIAVLDFLGCLARLKRILLHPGGPFDTDSSRGDGSAQPVGWSSNQLAICLPANLGSAAKNALHACSSSGPGRNRSSVGHRPLLP
jgi:hypothetical protein